MEPPQGTAANEGPDIAASTEYENRKALITRELINTGLKKGVEPRAKAGNFLWHQISERMRYQEFERLPS
jgi:hypothetical protein